MKSTGKSTAESSPAQWLAGVLTTSADSWKAEAKTAADHAAQVRSSLAEATANLQNMQMKVAMLKTGMEVQALPSPVIAEILNKFSANEEDLSSRANSMTGEIKEAEKRSAQQQASGAAIDQQIQILKSLKQPGAWSDQIQAAYDKYTSACGAFADGSKALIEALSEKTRLVKQEKELLDGVLPRLKSLRQASMPELLQRGKSKPPGEQFADLLHRIVVLPGQAWSWFSGLLHSGRIQAFLLKKSAPLIGLLLFIVFLGWAAHRLKRWLEPLLDYVRSRSRETGFRVLISLARGPIAMAYPIVFVLWLITAYGVLGLFDVVPALIVLYVVAGLAVFAIFVRVINDLLRGTGTEAGSIALINRNTAPSFCLRMKLFTAYVILGFVFIEILGLDQFPIPLKLFASQLYDIGVLLWTCLLLRPGYLKTIIDRPVSAGWNKWLRSSWTALLFLVISVCLIELLGFQSFSIYALRSVVLTEGLIGGVVFLAVTGKGTLKEIFEREHVLVKVFGEVGIYLRQLYLPARLALSAVLIAGLVAGLLLAWGIGVSSLIAFVGHLGAGVNLGFLHLSPLTVFASGCVLYAGFRGSGLFRKFLRSRVFPRTGWDLGVQYSIATILQYSIIVAGVLLAMNILGFPLASLTLLAGALGIGAGLGLQNVIANFVSGLVLLFERPVKVGDLLMVDGQWGEVKAIKMRSTVFQTFDRSVLIIPNSDLLSGKIVNWSHYGLGPNRLTLKVGVSYSSDVKLVTRLLHEICKANARVLKDPAPQIFFEAYGDSSLDFSIRVFVHTPSERVPATHEINTAIFEVFRDNGIEIPFPQRDLHIIDDRGVDVKNNVEFQMLEKISG
ncbi:MAG: mechanosensitive ion channel [Syntrophobacteraceae bacterium]|nr:mechanosensitive ion channel [Syntrophobacteraceae bacterium]